MKGLPTARIIEGDVTDVLRSMPDESVHCVVTSPPYWGLRDYGADGQIGLEETPEAWCERLVGVFREVRRVLRRDGTCWVNIGDRKHGGRWLCLPHRLVLALAADWILQEEFVWQRTNPAPVGDLRHAIRAHEMVFLLVADARGHHFNRDTLRRPHAPKSRTVHTQPVKGNGTESAGGRLNSSLGARRLDPRGALQTTVWPIATRARGDHHFSAFPEELPRRCISAGCPDGGTVLDPFAGSGTTGVVACGLGRDFVGIELNPEYAAMARKRIRDAAPLTTRVAKA